MDDVRAARRYGLFGFVLAAGLPALVWHDLATMIAADFRWEAQYLLTGWIGYGLIAAGLLLFIPVLASIGRTPESRLYPRGRGALAGWATTLYLLGIAIAIQIDQIAHGLSS